MKLYTEEQVRQAMQDAMIPSIYQMDLWGQLTPIELPSEKEIAEKIVNIVDTPEYGKLVYAGALWMLEQIKQQDNDKI